MPLNIDYSKAMPLRDMYGHKLLEDYYDYSGDLIFEEIEQAIGKPIKRVVKIYNPQLYGMYLLHKEELLLKNENNSKDIVVKELYHSTSESNARNIAQNNIDWRLTRRSRFGIGDCFSPCPWYANRHSSSRGAFVIFEVLLNNVEEIDVDYELEVPTKLECDATSGNGELVYVKFDDNTFYPKYIVYMD